MSGITLTIPGTPVPQGSMTCVGRRGFHQLIPSNRAALKPWRDQIARAADQAAAAGHWWHDQPVHVTLRFTIVRPDTIPRRVRPWPHVARGGDLDKLVRAVLDGLVQGHLLDDDSRVVILDASKAYPDTHPSPAAHGYSADPGVIVTVRPIGDTQDTLI